MTTRLFYLILFFGGIWLILDDIFGSRKLTAFTANILKSDKTEIEKQKEAKENLEKKEHLIPGFKTEDLFQFAPEWS